MRKNNAQNFDACILGARYGASGSEESVAVTVQSEQTCLSPTLALSYDTQSQIHLWRNSNHVPYFLELAEIFEIVTHLFKDLTGSLVSQTSEISRTTHPKASNLSVLSLNSIDLHFLHREPHLGRPIKVVI
jgi:hypothetical protein